MNRYSPSTPSFTGAGDGAAINRRPARKPAPGAAGNREPRSASLRAWLADAELASRVRNRLLAELMLDALSIHVEAKGGVVSLSGQVWRGSSLKLAERAAGSVAGVSRVRNALSLAPVIEPAGAAAGAPLAARVKARLLEQVGIGSFDIGVAESGGRVTLTGSVPDRARHGHALRVAGAVNGVSGIEDALRIEAAD